MSGITVLVTCLLLSGVNLTGAFVVLPLRFPAESSHDDDDDDGLYSVALLETRVVIDGTNVINVFELILGGNVLRIHTEIQTSGFR